MKLGDKAAGIFMLILLSGIFILGTAGTLKYMLYMTTGTDGSISKWNLSKVNEDEYILSYNYYNTLLQEEFVVERTIDAEEYDMIKDKSKLKIRFIKYFSWPPRVGNIDPKRPWFIAIFVLILIPFAIKRNILFLRGKLDAKDFL